MLVIVGDFAETRNCPWQERGLKLREELLAVEEERLRGARYYSIDEIDGFLDTVIEDVENGSIKAV